MKLINLDGSPNINLISHPLAFLRAQAAAATAGRQSPETVDVKGGGVSFRRQQSESGGDITIAETNPEILGKFYIYVHEISANGANEVDYEFTTWEWKCARRRMRWEAWASSPARSARGTSSAADPALWDCSPATGTTCSSSGGPRA